MNDRERWNQKYQNRNLHSYKNGPSQWLLDHEDLLLALPKTSGLDIASGFGRNSFYLEKLGFQMDAVDVSDIAIEWMQAEADEKKLQLSPHRLDLAVDPFPQSAYGIIICFNFLFRELFDQIKSSLHAGGLIVYETVFTDDIEVLGNKMNPDYVLAKNELLHAFEDFRIISYRERSIEIRNGRKKAMASIVAEKP